MIVRSQHLVAIDLGTSCTQIWSDHRVVRMPTTVIVDRRGSVIAGDRVRAMVGRTPPGLRVVRPLAQGVVNDLDGCILLLRHALDAVRAGRRSRVCISVPAGATDVERRSVALACEAVLGSAPALVIDEPLAGAIGADLPVHGLDVGMLVDVGEGITEAVVTNSGAAVALASHRVGGADLDTALARFLRDEFDLLVGDATAERLKRDLAATCRSSTLVAGGRHRLTGRPKSVEVEATVLRRATAETVRSIAAPVTEVLARTPPELCADLIDRGIVLVGGSAAFPGVRDAIAAATGLPVRFAAEPTTSVLRGNVALVTGAAPTPTRCA